MVVQRASLPPGVRRSSSSLFSAILLLTATAACGAAHAQAKYTASHPLRLQSFGTLEFLSPHNENTRVLSGLDYGATVGANLDFATHLWIVPGADLRLTHAQSKISHQTTFGIGARAVLPFRRVQPYGNFLVGGGWISFPSGDPGYPKDTSRVFTYGGGVDVPIKNGWALKVEVEEQRWRLSMYAQPFFPVMVNAGVRYEVHGSKHGPR